MVQKPLPELTQRSILRTARPSLGRSHRAVSVHLVTKLSPWGTFSHSHDIFIFSCSMNAMMWCLAVFNSPISWLLDKTRHVGASASLLTFTKAFIEQFCGTKMLTWYLLKELFLTPPYLTYSSDNITDTYRLRTVRAALLQCP